MTLKKDIKLKLLLKSSNVSSVSRFVSENYPGHEGMTTQSLHNKLTRGSLKYTEAMVLADAIGQKIVWVDK